MGSHGIALYTGRITLSLIAVGCAVVDVPSAGRGALEAGASDIHEQDARRALVA